MSGTVTVQFSVATQKRGSEVRGTTQYDKDDWDELTLEEQEEEVRQTAFNSVSWHYHESVSRQTLRPEPQPISHAT